MMLNGVKFLAEQLARWKFRRKVGMYVYTAG